MPIILFQFKVLSRSLHFVKAMLLLGLGKDFEVVLSFSLYFVINFEGKFTIKFIIVG